MRIVVASSDGKNVNVHFGMDREFLIFDVNGGNMELKETRSSLPWCGENADTQFDDDAIEKTVSVLSDCEAVLIGKIGECAYDDLQGSDIFPFESNDSIENTLKDYLNCRKVARRTVEGELSE